jgi:hypothetical protein
MGFVTSDFANVMNSSGTPQPRRNVSEIFPLERKIVSIPIVDGPK